MQAKEDDDEIEMRKSSTMNSMYIGSTISKPNVESIINAVATILHSQMLEVSLMDFLVIILFWFQDQNQGKKIEQDSELFFFSEEKYILEKPDAFDSQRIALLRETPTIENILEFIKALYDCAQFSPECCIICLVYINRLIAFTEMPLQPTNWRPLLLCSLLVAQKVWDDRYLTNADFAFIYPFFVTEEINKLEQKFLELIQYNVTVKSNLYAKYYFELRALFKDNEKEFPMKPLDKKDADALELRSADYKQTFETQAPERLNNTFGSLASKPMWVWLLEKYKHILQIYVKHCFRIRSKSYNSVDLCFLSIWGV